MDSISKLDCASLRSAVFVLMGRIATNLTIEHSQFCTTIPSILMRTGACLMECEQCSDRAPQQLQLLRRFVRALQTNLDKEQP